jgi:hypothetical protein
MLSVILVQSTHHKDAGMFSLILSSNAIFVLLYPISKALVSMKAPLLLIPIKLADTYLP